MNDRSFTAFNFALNRLQGMVSRRDKALATFKSKLDSNPIHAMEWLDGTPQAVIEGNFAETVQDQCDGKTASEIRKIFMDTAAELDRRIDNWRPASGSSPFHNAIETERLLAMREVRNVLCMGLVTE